MFVVGVTLDLPATLYFHFQRQVVENLISLPAEKFLAMGEGGEAVCGFRAGDHG